VFELNIFIPHKVVGTFEIEHVCLPGAQGMLGIGMNHAPFVTKVNSGILTIETSKKETIHYYVSEGFAQVAKNRLDILIENVEAPSDIDKMRAKKAEERALQRLKQLSPEVNIPRALGALKRARERLLLIENLDSRKH
jgi:F-type H+-transporting ATPase subunit epsilon